MLATGSQMLKTVGLLSFCVLQEGLPLGITRMVKRRYYLMEQAKLANIIGEHSSALLQPSMHAGLGALLGGGLQPARVWFCPTKQCCSWHAWCWWGPKAWPT